MGKQGSLPLNGHYPDPTPLFTGMGKKASTGEQKHIIEMTIRKGMTKPLVNITC